MRSFFALREIAAVAPATLLLVSVAAVRSAPVPPDVPQSVIDAARAEIERGRYWHASRILREGIDLSRAGPEAALLLARAEAGWRNWEGVRELLAEAPWLTMTDDGGNAALGTAHTLLGQAYEADEEWALAAESFAAARLEPLRDPLEIHLREARARGMAGDALEALDLIGELSGPARAAADWLLLELARHAASRGEPEGTRRYLDAIGAESVARRGWDLVGRAWDEAGRRDSAIVAFGEWTDDPVDAVRAEAWATIGELHLLSGRRSEARPAFEEALRAGSNATAEARAARGLVDLGTIPADLRPAAARVLSRSGDAPRALRVYDLWIEAAGGIATLDPDDRLARVRMLMAAGRSDEAVSELRALSPPTASPEVAAPALSLWIQLRRGQGRTDDVRTLQNRLVERYPERPEAVDIVFFSGDAAHDRGDLGTAFANYRRTVEVSPSSDRGGLARMRLAQIHLHRGDTATAAEVFEEYLEAYPNGRRWDEASFWAARTRAALGDSAAAARHVDRLRAESPFSYYVVVLDSLEGRPFRVDLPEGPAPAPAPAWLQEGVHLIGVLERLGLAQARTRAYAELRERADSSDEHLRLLAEGLAEQGRAIDAVVIGRDLQARGNPWTDRLARIVFPFPYRELILAEAEEAGVDPFLVAAVIRQESAFLPSAVSSADARGLMQVLPTTGRSLARTEEIQPFRVEALFAPEINVHLGTRYMAEMSERYPRLPFLLSAYNAGPTRANRWAGFPEAADLLRLTERIPFSETRDYVKVVTRNRAVYRALWGEVVEEQVGDGPERLAGGAVPR